MAVERTLFIVKPDATSRSLVGKILAHVEGKGFKLVEARYTRLTREQCNEFYAEHLGKPFFPELVDFMTSGPVLPVLPRARERGGHAARGDRRDRPGAGRRGHDPQAVRRIQGPQLGPRLGQRSSAEREVKLFFGVAALTH